MNRKDWIVLPKEMNPKELTEEESYAKLLVLMRELDEERGLGLSDKQVEAIKKVLSSLITVRARIKICGQE